MFKKLILSLLGSAVFVGQVSAQDYSFYTVLGAGYAESNSQLVDDKGASYRFGVGYQLHRQWNVELGYQQIIKEDFQLPGTNNNAQDGIDASAIYLTLLGKASAQRGELFYRIGALSIDVEEQQFHTGSATCAAGQGTTLNVGAQSYTQCTLDESVIAGVIGIGYDVRISSNVLIRTEIEHIKGEDDVEFNAAYVGLRYNF